MNRDGADASSVAISGAGGLIGSALVASLQADGCRVLRLVRREAADAREISYDPWRGKLEPEALEGLDAVVHLAGENIASGRWTENRKTRIRESRVRGTALIARALAGLERPPRVWLNASAIGYYGDRGDETLDESSGPGSGFLPETCAEWEAAVEPAERTGLRVVRMRIGVVLSSRGGALARMLTPFRLALGGPVGDGRQYMSWIGLDDLVRAVRFLLRDSAPGGPVNLVAPQPVRNAEFTRALGGVLRRPAVLPMPAPIVRALFGEMGRELLLAGTRVLPRRLEDAGFEFRHGRLEEALRFELERETGG
jgi:uncharacterized protein (TIGR01777 family)